MKYLYFSAPWCGPCKMFGPVMERVSTKVNVQKVNVDENQDLAMRYSVRSIPTVVLVGDDGKEWIYKQTAMVNFVQNRGLFFTHGTHHQAINNHGTNKEDGRLTLTYFLQRKPFYY